MRGIVYTETVVHSAPEQFVSEAPYQLLIVQLEDGKKVTARTVAGSRVAIGDAVQLDHDREGIGYYRKADL